jgi:hypothetical protein
MSRLDAAPKCSMVRETLYPTRTNAGTHFARSIGPCGSTGPDGSSTPRAFGRLRPAAGGLRGPRPRGPLAREVLLCLSSAPAKEALQKTLYSGACAVGGSSRCSGAGVVRVLTPRALRGRSPEGSLTLAARLRSSTMSLRRLRRAFSWRLFCCSACPRCV